MGKALKAAWKAIAQLPHHFPALRQMGPTRLLSLYYLFPFFLFSFLFPIFVRHLCFAYVISHLLTSHIFFLPSSPIYFSLNINIFLLPTTIEFQPKPFKIKLIICIIIVRHNQHLKG